MSLSKIIGTALAGAVLASGCAAQVRNRELFRDFPSRVTYFSLVLGDCEVNSYLGQRTVTMIDKNCDSTVDSIEVRYKYAVKNPVTINREEDEKAFLAYDVLFGYIKSQKMEEQK